MSRVSFVIVACLLAAMLEVPAEADTSGTGAGVLESSPLALAVQLGTVTQTGYRIIAYQTKNAATTRVVVVRSSDKFGLASIDDIEIGSSALSLVWNQQDSAWHLTLKASLPNNGEVDLLLVSPWGFEGLSQGCGGFYEFLSPTYGMSEWGWVSGTIAGNAVRSPDCLVWGSDVSGNYTNPPLGRN